MRRYVRVLVVWVVVGSGSMFVAAPSLHAATIITYDLQADWSDEPSDNPNGPWRLWHGLSLLPHQADIGPACCGLMSPLTQAWAPSSSVGSFLPLWAKATGDSTTLGYPSPNFLTGDIVVHSWDPGNGNAPSLGQASLTWTAPFTGTIDIDLSLWYAQQGLSRSND